MKSPLIESKGIGLSEKYTVTVPYPSTHTEFLLSLNGIPLVAKLDDHHITLMVNNLHLSETVNKIVKEGIPFRLSQDRTVLHDSLSTVSRFT